MCEHCSADTKSYTPVGDKVFGKYFLVRATRDGNEMKNGDWGLVTCNDPDLIFGTTPWPCPFFDITNDEVVALPKEDLAELDRWEIAAGKFSMEALKSIPEHCAFTQIAEFAVLAQKLGWDPVARREKGCSVGWRLEEWMFQHLGKYIFRHPEPLSKEQLAEWERADAHGTDEKDPG